MAPKKNKKSAKKKTQLPPTIPDNFIVLVNDFVKDLSVTFPEFIHLWEKWSNPEMSEEETRNLFDYCLAVFPERFFDILYQNEDIFKADSEFNTLFLPGVDFKILYNCENVSETTRKAIWKYLQVLLLATVNSVKDKANFGDTMNIFDGINEEELQAKLSETLSGITDFFKDAEGSEEASQAPQEGHEGPQGDSEARPQFNFENMNMPNAEDLHGHLKGLFDGKIGSLAKEMAAEIASEFSDVLGGEADDARSAGDVLKNIMKNPKKIMDLMKTVGAKLKTKMSNGDISQEELMKEASEWMSKMKDMGGEGDLGEMIKKMAKDMGGLGGLAGMGGLGKNMKLDTNALDRMTKQQKMKERMRAKLEQRRADAQAQVAKNNLLSTEIPGNYVFRTDDGPQEKSMRPIVQKTDEEIEALIKEIEGDTPIVTKSSKKKKKKSK